MKKKLFMVIPCYNEEEVLKETNKHLIKKYKELISSNIISNKSKIMYVNDGSSDSTWQIIKDLENKEKYVTGISLSHNKGHQNALVAGLLTAKEYADVVISMDADLQDDINAIDSMLDTYLNEDAQIVYGIRSSRKKDTWLKKYTAQSFYCLMHFMGVEIFYNHADFRLTSKKVLDNFANFQEVNLFLRGIFPLIGFKSSIVYYERTNRFAGKSKYSIKKMIDFAWDGITSFSIKPLRFIINIGLLLLLISFIILITFLINNLTNISYFIFFAIFFIGSIQTIAIGIVGEYIGKTYNETKKRPRYIIEHNLMEKKDEK